MQLVAVRKSEVGKSLGKAKTLVWMDGGFLFSAKRNILGPTWLVRPRGALWHRGGIE